MDAPKISVLIPMYNRKHYIEQCIDSALNQTFQDYEIIVCDNDSTDGSADFVAERYVAEISSGKIKLLRNEKNMGATFNNNRLLREASGKYVMFLHSDDMFLPHALVHMYEVAENFNADVVHECKYLTTAPDGIIEKGTPLKITDYDRCQVDNVTVMPDDPNFRFYCWVNDIGTDAQHNIFNKEFFIKNGLRFETFDDTRLLLLKCLMKAKVFVKTPVVFYIYRNSPDSDTNSKFPPERVAKLISDYIKLSRHLDEFFASDDFFKDKPELQYLARSHLFFIFDNFWIIRNGVYKNGITPELHRAVESAFREYFGKDAPLPTFFFHWLHTLICNKPSTIIAAPPHTAN